MNNFYDFDDKETSVVQYDISVSPNDFNVMTINTLIEEKIISMPSFQRNYVWDRKRASKFIESLILGLPVPQIFLYQEERNKYSIIDGQQRTLSLYFFIKQKFPRSGKRRILRKIFDDYGSIPEEVLNDKSLFQDFKLQFSKQENGKVHPLNGKKYKTLSEEQRTMFNLMPMRCMTIRQNEAKDGDAIYEIFSRLNTGGINLSPQEIRGCLYRSKFYKMIYDLNSDKNWRKLLGKEEEDDKFRDVEIILRAYAMLDGHEVYKGSMLRFLNRFSKDAQGYTDDRISDLRVLFDRFIDVCSKINTNGFRTKTKSFNISLFESVFVAVAERINVEGLERAEITQEAFNSLKANDLFQKAITHSTSHVDVVKRRLNLARSLLYPESSRPKG